MDTTAANKAGHAQATVTVANAVPVSPKRFHSFGLPSLISICCSTPILLTLVSAPAHSPCSADVSCRSIGYVWNKAHVSSVLELGLPRPHLRPEWASFCHICDGSGLAAATLQRDCTWRGLKPDPVHLRLDFAHLCNVCHAPKALSHRPGLGRVPHVHLNLDTPAISAPGPDSTLPPLRRDWAHLHYDTVHLCHLCAGLVSPLQHLHRSCAHPFHDSGHPCHICTKTGHIPAMPAPGSGSTARFSPELGASLPHLRWDWAHPCHITGTVA
jgi:hypothetical protein